MESEEERVEYVLNEITLIYQSLRSNSNPLLWKVSQFHPKTVELVLNLMENLSVEILASPHLFIREFALCLNSFNNKGILVEHLSGDCNNGVIPIHWSDSYEIIEKYLKDKVPVKYGQCWVYAGLFNTFCRTVGISCRIVTIFKSLHGSKPNAEYYFDNDFHELPHLNVNSIWYFNYND